MVLHVTFFAVNAGTAAVFLAVAAIVSIVIVPVAAVAQEAPASLLLLPVSD